MGVTKKRALLLGGTGALGVYLAPQMVKDGFEVHVTSRRDRVSSTEGITYIKGDAQDVSFLNEVLNSSHKYDVVVDFMVYSTPRFSERYKALLGGGSHYIYVSSYRVFSDAPIISERTPRLLDITDDETFLKTTDYSLEKARQEDILRSAEEGNWTIVRPSITYSKERFQLGTLEADSVVERALKGESTVIYKDMLSRYTTMTWAGDVAKMISALAGNEKAFGEDYNVVTGESRTWAEVAEIYHETIDLKLKPISYQKYLYVMGGGYAEYQIKYDRMFNRKLDNSKILSFMNISQQDLMPLKEGLSTELASFKSNRVSLPVDYKKQARIDKVLGTLRVPKLASKDEKGQYLKERVVILRFLDVDTLRRRVRIRTRLRNALRRIKRATRIRTRLMDLRELFKYRSRIRAFRSLAGGIVTLIDYNNYGNVLQRYALQEFLLRKKLPFVSFDHSLPIESDPNDPRVRYISEFVARHVYTLPIKEAGLLKNYIVGSDQIWRDFSYKDPKRDIGFFFLNFLEKSKVNRIAYAASFGRNSLSESKITPEVKAYLDPLIKMFDAVSVRELSAQKIVRDEWGVDADPVIDPTMLLTKADYSRIISRSVQNLSPVDGCFAYLIGVTNENEQLLKKAERYIDKQVYRIDLADYSGPLPPVEQWLLGLRDAELAVVDSFHGAVFSIINNTNFVVLENKGSGMERMINLLDTFNIEGRIIKHSDVNSFAFEDLGEIDWARVNKKLDTLRAKSAEWLLKAIATK